MSTNLVPILSPNVVAIDIETNGLPQTRGWNSYFPPDQLQHYNNSRVVSIAFVDNTGFQHYHIIKPTDFIINNSVFHGITQDTAVAEGVTLHTYFNDILLARLQQADGIVGHNVQFDVYVLASELMRQGLDDVATVLLNLPMICTGAMACLYFRTRRTPKLINLYKLLFADYRDENHKPVCWHHAIDDAQACLRCYHHMRKRHSNKFASARHIVY